MAQLKITLIGNAGVMIQGSGDKLLIDALHGDSREDLIYPAPSRDFFRRLEFGEPPVDGVSKIFFTHHHPDHFSPSITAHVLNRRKDLRVMADEETIHQLFQYCRDNRLPLPATQTMGVPWRFPGHYTFQEPGFRVDAISFLHEGVAYTGVPMVGYIFTIDGISVFFAGDARLTEGNLQHLDQRIDLAILPFPFVGTAHGCRLIQEYIRPSRILAVHLPDPQKDKDHYIEYARQYHEKVQDILPPVTFMDKVWQEEIFMPGGNS